jgi:16S rRNA (cytosine967-C5)-methyltransferase
MMAALFLCTRQPNELLGQLRPEWNKKAADSLQEKISILGCPFHMADIFPFQDELTQSIDPDAFATSHLTQPDLFLRIRPHRKQQVLEKLKASRIKIDACGENCLSLPNTTKVEDLLELNKEVVVQDYSSQRMREFLQRANAEILEQKSKIRVWDCCAASGGKSILAVDVLGNIDLSASDIRPSIIYNLKQRFKEAGIDNYKAFVADLTTASSLDVPSSDIVICDVPCSGSGTWSRTPEQLYFFRKEKINYYAGLQRKIAGNTIPHLSKNGLFLYITCSVFRKENEEAVEFIQQNFHLHLLEYQTFIGYDKRADTMFGALFRKAE